MDTIGQVLTLLGSLGLFLYGMKSMSEALQRVAGTKMRSILSAMTSNRFKGVFTGFLVTTVIQSSSATTVMVVSFVNAGLLSLIGAMGVIMGANIGTTVTAWLISIIGFKIKISALSLPLIGLSLPLLFSKNSKRKSWGEFVIGFAILFIGLQWLKESVPDIKNNPGAFEFLKNYTDLGFLSTLFFVGVGTILTIIIQSSSATMALTLVMCYNGLIPFEMAAAMVLGENIGTTITANIAAMVANVSAKRAARAHLIFNLIGVIWMLLLFSPFLRGINYLVGHYHGISVLDGASNPNVTFDEYKTILPIGLSLFHTVFNILNMVMLIGFAGIIAKFTEFMVPDRGEEDEEYRLKYISNSFMSTAEISTIQAKNEIVVMAERTRRMFNFVPQLLVEKKEKNYNKLIHKIEKYEDIIDRMEEEIANYITRISESDLSRQGTERVRAMLKIIDDIESIGDVCFQLSRSINNKNQQKVWFTQDLRDQLSEMFILVNEVLDNMISNLETDYHKVEINHAIQLENQLNEMRNTLREQNAEDLKDEKYNYKTGSFYSELFRQNEKIGDFAMNVNESIANCS